MYLESQKYLDGRIECISSVHYGMIQLHYLSGDADHAQKRTPFFVQPKSVIIKLFVEFL